MEKHINQRRYHRVYSTCDWRMTNFTITSEAIVSAKLLIQLEDPDCGAIATFSGTVRQH
ncbi:uncharacterized protein METZ01_LOCUS418209, partial [marine metagenome]